MSRVATRGLAILTIFLAGCGSGGEASLESTTMTHDPCAHVVAAELVSTGETYRVSVTVHSNDLGWEKYADAWEVRTIDGEVLGTRVLAHPHEDEQPFTRTLDGVVIPAGVTEVVIAARDSVAGFCGDTLTIPL